MNMNTKLHTSHKTLPLISLLTTTLIFSLFTNIFMNYTTEALENDLHVKNEEELKNAINNTSNKKATTINIDNDITLTETLKIPTNKNITLTSNKITEYYKLIGAEYKSTIFVDKDSTLKIDGVIVTHIKTAISAGGGIYVEENGLLILYSGEISNNEAVDHGSPFSPGASGGGVCNRGVFEMYGGKISGNQVYGLGSSGGGSGGGVFNTGIFTMTGGEITNNVANVYGGGVFNTGIFTMTGGEITNNIAENWGGGVSTFGTFDRLGGVISGNTAKISGNNVYPDDYDSGTSNGGSNNSNNNGSSTDKVELSEGGFTLREVGFMCVGVGGLVIGVVGVVLFFISKKELEYIKKKNKLTNDNS